MVKTYQVVVSDSSPVLVAKGPCRATLAVVSGGVAASVGDNAVTFGSGLRIDGPQISAGFIELDSGDKLFAIADGSGGNATTTVNVFLTGA